MPIHEDRDELFARPRSSAPGYAIGSAPPPPPMGTVWVEELGTYVESDVAETLPLQTRGEPVDISQVPFPVQQHQTAEADMEASTPQPERMELDTPSEVLNEVASHFTQAEFDEGVEQMIEGDFESTLERISEATGFDLASTPSIIDAIVEDATPLARENLMPGGWDALVYAASRTDDPFARRIVAGFVQGKLPPENLSKAYALWYESLPEAEDS